MWWEVAGFLRDRSEGDFWLGPPQVGFLLPKVEDDLASPSGTCSECEGLPMSKGSGDRAPNTCPCPVRWTCIDHTAEDYMPTGEVTAEMVRDAALFLLLRERGAGLMMTDAFVRKLQAQRELEGTWISTQRNGNLETNEVSLVREVKP